MLRSNQMKKWLSILQTSVAKKSPGGRTSLDLKILIDSNVWISAAVYGGEPEKALQLCLDKVSTVVSEEITDEIRDIFRNIFGAPYRWINSFVCLLEEACEVPLGSVPVPISAIEVRDLEDLHVISAAVHTGCDFILTGDKDLLELGSYKNIVIISPKDFLGLAK
ncbi:MAG: putative toxin-antitoxin system toxin component, PIN family [Candidatus Saccharimonadales bacterium]